jgi:hypothetical protein
MDLSIFYYSHNSKKNTVEIRLQLLGEYVEEELTKSADYEA